MFERDGNADGTADYRETYASDANGSRRLFQQDSNADGIVDHRQTFASAFQRPRLGHWNLFKNNVAEQNQPPA